MTTRRLLAVMGLALTGPVAAARADRYEASLALETGGGIARVGERGTDAEQVPAFGLAARLTHAWSNRIAWDASVAGTVTQPATFPDAEAIVGGRPTRGEITRRTIVGRAEVGGELRLGGGAGLIPTIRLAVGPQLRHRTASDLGMFVDVVPADTSVDLAVTLGIGADLRLGRSRVVGLVAGVTHAQPFGDSESYDTVALTLRVSSYWYPRWWSPEW